MWMSAKVELTTVRQTKSATIPAVLSAVSTCLAIRDINLNSRHMTGKSKKFPFFPVAISLFRKCIKQKCRPHDHSCASKPLQISYHLMNHTSPLKADRALFKMTLQNSGTIPKTFRLIKGNDQNRFQVVNFTD